MTITLSDNVLGHFMNSLNNLKQSNIHLMGKKYKIIRRSCGDGKERRSSTGNSKAKSSYPIPEAPEHQSQLGDMKLSCPCPVWSETLEMKINLELRGKSPSKEKHREFAKQNRGNTGRTNICGTPLSEIILEHPTLDFDLQKQYSCESLKSHQVCIDDR